MQREVDVIVDPVLFVGKRNSQTDIANVISPDRHDTM